MLVNLTALALCASCIVYGAKASCGEVEGPRHSLAVGPAVADFDYRESDDGARLNHEQGTLPGLDLKWQTLGARYLAEAEFSYFRGDVDYDGATQGGTQVNTDTAEEIWRGEVAAGWRYEQSPRIEYQAIAGIGYRDWQRDIRAMESARGLLETYTFWYGSIGFRALYYPSAKHSWKLQLSAKRPLNPQVQVEFENALDTVRLDLGEETTVDISLSWQYDFQASLGLEAELFHQAWDMGRSADQVLTQDGVAVGTLFEPGSETTSTGFALRLFRRF